MASDASEALAVREDFLHAARTGNLYALMKRASQLDDGRGISRTVADIKDVSGQGALHFAASQAKIIVCEYLLEELKIEVDPRDNNGDTPLIHAAQQGDTETVKYLIEQGADPSIVGSLGTALHHSARIGNTQLLKFLLSRGADVESPSVEGTPLIWAAYFGQLDAMEILLEHKANPNAVNGDGATPLLISAAAAVIPNMVLSPIIQNDNRDTSLFSSIAAASIPCLELLVKAGANLNICRNGVTPLHMAAAFGKLKIINLLLKAGADPNITKRNGLYPIQVAAKGGHRESVEALLPVTSRIESIPNWTVDGIMEHMKSGATYNASRYGVASLHAAAADGNLEIINCLLRLGADPNTDEENGLKPIQVAAKGGHRESVEALFPVTSPIESILNWTVDGIIEYMQFRPSKKQKNAA